MKISRSVRLFALVAALLLSVAYMLMEPQGQMVMEGQWVLTQAPTGTRCPVVEPMMRQWNFDLPPEGEVGTTIVQLSLAGEQCRLDCPVNHALRVRVLEWHARAGFFSGFSEVEFEATLLRTGEGCEDSTVVEGHMSVDQGRRGDPQVVLNALGRWALEYYRGSYDELFLELAPRGG